jgi:hypothetical protein
MVKTCWLIQRRTALRQASSHRDTMCGQASAARHARNRCLTQPGLRIREARGSGAPEKSELPAATDDRTAAEWSAKPG